MTAITAIVGVAVIAVAVIAIPIRPVTIIVAAFGPGSIAFGAIRAIIPVVALTIVGTARRSAIFFAIIPVDAVGRHLVIAIIASPVVTLLWTRFFKARTRFGHNPEIMIRKLEIIFGHHPVTSKLGITGKALIFLEKLRGIATRTIVDAVALFAATILWALSTPAATAASLTIVEQEMSLFSGVKPVFGYSSLQDPNRDVPQHIFRLPKPDHPSHSLR